MTVFRQSHQGYCERNPRRPHRRECVPVTLRRQSTSRREGKLVPRSYAMRALLGGVLVALSALVLASASAGSRLSSCSPSSHCYGRTDYSPSSTSGVIAVINTHAISSGSPCNGFATSEMWLLSQVGWVETGINAGRHADGTCGSGDQFFWAEFSTNQSPLFVEHFPGGSVGLNTNYTYKIMFDSGTTYEVDRNGNTIGWANYQQCCGNGARAGAESDVEPFTDSGEASGLQKQISGSWSYGWTGATAENTGGAFTMSGTPSSDESWSH
jgi:hypothetical protein